MVTLYLLQNFRFKVPAISVAHLVTISPGMIRRHVIRSIIRVFYFIKLKMRKDF